jgi:hypothetical protein
LKKTNKKRDRTATTMEGEAMLAAFSLPPPPGAVEDIPVAPVEEEDTALSPAAAAVEEEEEAGGGGGGGGTKEMGKRAASCNIAPRAQPVEEPDMVRDKGSL